MATAEKTTVQVERVVVEDVEVVRLELSVEEAMVLRHFVGVTSGGRGTRQREILNGLHAAFESAGLRVFTPGSEPLDFEQSPRIRG